MRLEFFPLRFEFTARESLFFPPGLAANTLRGAFGTIFRQLACVTDCPGARDCSLRQSCAYARVFEPGAKGSGPSGLADWPRPFVFRARHLDGKAIQAGQPFYFDLNVFSREHELLDGFVSAFAELGREGLGPGRGHADLARVVRVPGGEKPLQVLWAGPGRTMKVDAVSLDLAPPALAVDKVRVHFLSPTELKHEERLAPRPEFPILFARLRDRISNLRALYGAGPLDLDFRGSGTRAAAVRLLHWEGGRLESRRRSSRTSQVHSLGGFTGVAEYQGDLAEFLPYLEASRWTGVGRHAVWGNGEIGF